MLDVGILIPGETRTVAIRSALIYVKPDKQLVLDHVASGQPGRV